MTTAGKIGLLGGFVVASDGREFGIGTVLDKELTDERRVLAAGVEISPLLVCAEAVPVSDEDRVVGVSELVTIAYVVSVTVTTTFILTSLALSLSRVLMIPVPAHIKCSYGESLSRAFYLDYLHNAEANIVTRRRHCEAH